ncbi:MAG: lytic transglycosylase domain-containing protein [Micropepsaceae bacterium]
MTTPYGVRNFPETLRSVSNWQFGTGLANSNGIMLDRSPAAALTLRPTLPASADTVLTALRGAADSTGADFDYLLNTAMRESSLNPEAKAPTSSATGLFQFVEQTWLGTMKRHGTEHGFGAYADAIQVGKDGRYNVADKGLRQEILALRKDPKASSLMAGELTNDMRGDMEVALGRGVSAGELYVAHFLGPQAAVKMIKAAAATPTAAAANLFSDAASSNSNIFFGRDGKARSVGAVLDSLKAKHSGSHLSAHEFASAETPATAAGAAADAASQALRGSYAGQTASALTARDNLTNRFGMNTLIMSPLMAQMLSSMDKLPSIEAAFRPDDENPRPYKL